MNTKTITNICCIGVGYVRIPTMDVIAQKCPHIKVKVDMNDISEQSNISFK